MNKLDTLISELMDINERGDGDPEVSHIDKDGALLEYINNKRVEELFREGRLWYT